MTVIPSHLTDDELATCVDEYVKRVFDTYHSEDEFRNDYIHLIISANAGSSDSQYKISHKVNIGYGSGQSVDSNNAINGVRLAMQRELNDRMTPPTTVVRALPAPVEPEGEVAEFVEVNDDIPY